jgi:hypothetical protein
MYYGMYFYWNMVNKKTIEVNILRDAIIWKSPLMVQLIWNWKAICLQVERIIVEAW